jgi:hypothetical protein
MHEIEVEFTDATEFAQEIIQEGPVSRRANEFVSCFLNNVRILARKG